ncbi:MAG: PadR family transcriptional regulator [Chloroflexi bacterium]|nr:PadR family transcriptional regulator [Chloroflexota bacterium]MDL1941179.1 PadR family transcriptional regulator [Chloroflexi bacterium CFX2]
MSLPHAILGFLDYQPMTGYDLKKYFDQSVAHFWSATQSHIYKALETLEKDGMVESKIIPQEGKPNRREYHITQAGRAELRRWVVTPLPLAATREAWLIQIFFSHASSNDEIVALLQDRANQIGASLEAFHAETPSPEENAAAGGSERMRRLWQMTADYGAAYYKSELAWIETAIENVRKLPSS